MDTYKRHFIHICLAICAIISLGTLGYYVLEDGWTLFDALYMVMISITTVGYSEVHPLSTGGRILSIVIILFGLGIAASFATELFRFIVKGELQGIFGRKRMLKKIRHTSGHYIICGHGRTGSNICLKLHELDIPFVVIEHHTERLSLAQQRGFLTVEGDGKDDMTLINAGIERAAGLVVSLPDDSTTLLIAMAARELNPSIDIIAQGSDPHIERRLLRAGANMVFYPLSLGGEQIARTVAHKMGKCFDTSPVNETSDVFGYFLRIYKQYENNSLTVGEILSQTGAISAVAHRDSHNQKKENPPPTLAVQKGESLVLLMSSQREHPEKLPAGSSELITWSDKLSVGIPSIDEEHRGLVQVIHSFQNALMEGQGSTHISQLFDKLIAYTVVHFNNEEKLMEEYAYSDITAHKEKHRELTAQVMELNKNKRYVFPESVAGFLTSWLIDHILACDSLYGDFITHAEKVRK